MIAGFLAPSEGEIWVHGRPVAAVPPYRRKVGMVFQRLALFPHLSAAQNVAYPLRMRGFPRAEITPRVERYLSLVQLAGLGQRRIHELSGGQQQRVAIARALVFEPDLLLLDEPLAALDRKLREDMQLEFRRIQKELGVTTINVTHDQREALVMSDRLIVMEGGRIRQEASPAEIYAAPANPFVAGFVGITNFLPGRLLALDGDKARIQVGARELRGLCRTSAPNRRRRGRHGEGGADRDRGRGWSGAGDRARRPGPGRYLRGRQAGLCGPKRGARRRAPPLRPPALDAARTVAGRPAAHRLVRAGPDRLSGKRQGKRR